VPIPGARTPTSLPVAGVFTDYGSEQGVVMMSRLAYDRLFDDPGITSLGFFLPPGEDAEEAVARFQAMVGDDEVVFIRSNQGLRQASLEVFDRTFAITAVLRALAFAVAFIGVLSALMALQLERARELGVLRANGLTPGQVWTLVTTQTGDHGAGGRGARHPRRTPTGGDHDLRGEPPLLRLDPPDGGGPGALPAGRTPGRPGVPSSPG
jgi:ABC-type lipoprotein release transport system permease subunit